MSSRIFRFNYLNLKKMAVIVCVSVNMISILQDCNTTYIYTLICIDIDIFKSKIAESSVGHESVIH